MIYRHPIRLGLALAAIGLGVLAVRAAIANLHRPVRSVPVTQVQRGNIDLRVHAVGSFAALRSVPITAPAVGGGMLQIVHLATTGTLVKAGDVVVTFDPSEQQYNLEQARSDLAQAEQEITQANANAAVQAAQDQAALVKARFDVRQAQLEVSKNELLSKIDGEKNLLALNEANRALAQLQHDMQSHAASSRATLAVSQEKRNKARIAMQQAQSNIQAMTVRAPMDGVVQVAENWDFLGGIMFGGMQAPDYRDGDQVWPGNLVSRVLDIGNMELTARVSEADRANLNAGEPVVVRADAIPGASWRGKIKMISGVASTGDFWDGSSSRKFSVTSQLDRPDPRLRPGFSAEITILGGQARNVLYVPRQAVFEKDGGPVVFLKTGSRFEVRHIGVKYRTDSRVALTGLSLGDEVALVNPEQVGRRASGAPGSLTAPGGGP